MHGQDAFVVRMPDGSMAPEFLEGDYLYVDPDEPARAGGCVAIRDPENGVATARRYDVEDGRRVLRALTRDQPETVLDAVNETMVLGGVVFAGRKVTGASARNR